MLALSLLKYYAHSVKKTIGQTDMSYSIMRTTSVYIQI